MLKVIGNESVQDGVDGRSLLDEIAREGARRMLVAALETEIAAYLEAHREERDDDGHWKHLRTSNVIESPFATVRLRQRVTKGAGSRTKGLLMAYKLLDMARRRWRRLDGRAPPAARPRRYRLRGRRPAGRKGQQAEGEGGVSTARHDEAVRCLLPAVQIPR